MSENKPLLIVSSPEDESMLAGIISGTKQATELISVSEANKFEQELVDLPIPLEVKQDVRIADDSRRFRRKGNILGDRFYDGLKYKRINGKVRVASNGTAGKVVYQYERKIDEKTGKYYYEPIEGSQQFVRKVSKPSKSWIARQEAKLAEAPSSIQNAGHDPLA